MWVAKDKDGEVHLFYNKPHRDNVFGSNSWTIDVPEEIKEYTKGWEHYDAIIGYWMKVNSEDYPNLKWEDEPIEVMVESLEELRKGQIELKNVYHELIDYKTKQIESLTRVFRGVALEEVADILNDLEEKIHSKYKMIGNPYCSQNCRMVTIPYSSIQLGDNSLHEYIVDDKVVVTIYVRRNDFNTADILVSDLGGEYEFKERM